MDKKKSKTIIRVALLVGTVLSMLFVPWPLVKALIVPLPDTVQKQVDMADNYGFDGIIVYIDKAGSRPYSLSSGWHNRSEKTPAKPEALFKIASIAKLYDAVCISKLVHSGQLNLDKTLADYFPDLEGRIQFSDMITLGMMVQHKSGIPNYTDTPGFWENPPSDVDKTLELILDKPARFTPGKNYEYSNTNYLLINLLIEKTLGYRKFQFIQEEILEPLRLENTYTSIHDIDIDRLMSGYYLGIEEDIKSADYGSMIATAEDVGIFLRALNDGSIFEAGEQDIYSSIYEYNHDGLIPGYQSIAAYHKDIDAVVIQFTNTTDFSGYNWNLSKIMYNRILKILHR